MLNGQAARYLLSGVLAVLNGQAGLYLLAGLIAVTTLGRRVPPDGYPRASKRVRMPLA